MFCRLADGKPLAFCIQCAHHIRFLFWGYTMSDQTTSRPADCGCRLRAGSSPDRYISFAGIDCDGNARRLMAMIDAHLLDPAKKDAFWAYFERKRRAETGPRADELFLIHSNINQIRDYLEDWDDAPAQALLLQIELECC